jgi:predicted dehydrogenase
MIHVAILGAGIGREHLAGFRALKDRFTVRAIVDQDLERIEGIRQEGDNFSALSDIDEALADPQVHVIDICLAPTFACVGDATRVGGRQACHLRKTIGHVFGRCG